MDEGKSRGEIEETGVGWYAKVYMEEGKRRLNKRKMD